MLPDEGGGIEMLRVKDTLKEEALAVYEALIEYEVGLDVGEVLVYGFEFELEYVTG
jgi:hypothetical protein